MSRTDCPQIMVEAEWKKVAAPCILLLLLGLTTGPVAGGALDALPCPTADPTGVKHCETWAARYDAPTFGPDDVRDITVSPLDGTIFVTGLTDVTGSVRVQTVAHDPSTGSVLWASMIGDPGESTNGIALDIAPDGGLLFVAADARIGTDYDQLVLALDPTNGSITWMARYDGPKQMADRVGGLTVSPDGATVFVTGHSWMDPRWDVTTHAFDVATGDLIWTTDHDGPDGLDDQANDIATSPDGARVYVTGYTDTGDPARNDYLTLAYDAATGAILWQATYHGPRGGDRAETIAVAPDGARVFVTGSIAGEGLETATVAYDAATGAELWVTHYVGPALGWHRPAAIGVTSDSERVIVTGNSDGQESTSDRYQDYVTITYDASSGEELWAARYDGPIGGRDRAEDLVVSPDGTRVFVTGTSDSGGAPQGWVTPWWDVATLAYDLETGSLLWEARYDGLLGGGDSGRAIALAPGGSMLYVTGQTQGLDGTDFQTLAYATERPALP